MTIVRYFFYGGFAIAGSVATLSFLALIDHYVFVNARVAKAKLIDRSNINKQGYSPNKIDECEKDSKFDVIVIGTGISGLTTAALLSRRGYRVLCIEQHDVVGGATHVFTDKGFEFDTGVHYIGGNVANPKSLMGYLFDVLSLSNLKWSAMDDNFESAEISSSLQSNSEQNNIKIDVCKGFSNFKNRLIELFPKEKRGINEYFNLLKWSEISMPILFTLKLLPLFLTKFLRYFVNGFLTSFTETTTKDAIESCTQNQTLGGILCWLWGDYGLPPSKSSFLMNSIVSSHYLSNGSFYPTNGSSEFAKTFIPMIEATGGKVFVRAPVSSIILDSLNQKAIGIIVKERKVFANIIISSVGVLNTYSKLIPHSNIQEKVMKFIQFDCYNSITQSKIHNQNNHELEPSCSMFSVFIGLEGTCDELNLKASNRWIYPSWNHDEAWNKYLESVKNIRSYIELMKHTNFIDYDPTIATNYEIPLLFISPATAKDKVTAQLNNSNKNVIEILTVVDYQSFLNIDEKGLNSKPDHRGKR